MICHSGIAIDPTHQAEGVSSPVVLIISMIWPVTKPWLPLVFTIADAWLSIKGLGVVQQLISDMAIARAFVRAYNAGRQFNIGISQQA
jgi:hypothetical protein